MQSLSAAQSEALRRGNQQIDVEHLLAALLSQEGGLAASILKRAGANVEALGARLNQDLDDFERARANGHRDTADQ